MQCLTFNRLPSPARTLWMGFRNRKARYTGTEKIPTLAAVLPDFAIREKHLARYKALCGLEGEGFPYFYPLTLAYPVSLRLLSQKKIPFSMFRMLNREVTISCPGPLPTETPLRIHTALSSHTETEKGIDLCVSTDISHDHETLWRCTNTFFFKGVGTGKQEASSTPAAPGDTTPLEKPSILRDTTSVSWFLPHGNGFRFARVCGDSNGVHYSHRYAKMLGFEGAFAQPMLVLDRCMEKAGWGDLEGEISATVRLKGQVYYGRELTLNYMATNGEKAFELFCQGNGRACISGVLKE